MPEEKKTPINKMLVAIIVLLVLLVFAGVFIIFMFLSKPEASNAGQELVEVYEDGTVEILGNDTHLAVDEESLIGKDELQKKVDEGMINLKFSDQIIVENGKVASCNISNSNQNNLDMYVSLWLYDTQEEISRSGLIPVGSRLQQLDLNRSLDVGEYSGLLVYNQLEDNRIVGQVNVDVTLIVKS